jgi:hypothetical protein
MLFFLAFHFSLSLTPNCRNITAALGVNILWFLKHSVLKTMLAPVLLAVTSTNSVPQQM